MRPPHRRDMTPRSWLRLAALLVLSMSGVRAAADGELLLPRPIEADDLEGALAQGMEQDEFIHLKDEYLTLKRRVWQPHAKQASQLADVNERFLQRLVDALPADVGQVVEARVRLALYPQVYRDPTEQALRDMVNELRGLDAYRLDEGQLNQLDAFLFLHEQKYAALCEKLAAVVIERHTHLTLSNGTLFHDVGEELQVRQEELGKERASVVGRTESLIGGMLTEEQRDAVFGGGIENEH